MLTIHETYPGHHAERVSKEHLLVRGRGLLEEMLVLVPTPQSLVSEGIAKLAPSVLLEGEGGAVLAAVMHDAGIEFDLAHALAAERAGEPLQWAEVNAALMLDEEGASEALLENLMIELMRRGWEPERANIKALMVELSQADESRLYHHYELNYTPPDTESGRRLARR